MTRPAGYQRTDASESAFIDQILEHVSSALEEKDIPPLDGVKYVPVDDSVPVGAESYSYYMVTRTGIAQFCVDAAQDIPEADVFMTKFTHQLYPIKSSYKYTVKEMENAQFAQAQGWPLDLLMQKAIACKTEIMKGLDSVSVFGSASAAGLGADPGLVGLANHPSVPTYTIANGAMGSPLWSLKTPDEIIADMNGIVGSIISTTSKIYKPRRLILPVSRKQDITGRRMGDGSDETILSFFVRTRAAAGDPIEVVDWNPLATAGSGATTRMIAYDPNPEYVSHVTSTLFREGAPEYRNETWKIPMKTETAGVVWRKPLSGMYADGF